METIKEIIDKITSYNIFNYLLPGILFVILLKEISGYNLVQENILEGVFFYYFIGMVISRVGSIFIEPFLKKIRFLKFSEYKNFILASKKDSKIEVLSEVNNTYRTLLSTCLLLISMKLYFHIKKIFTISHNTTIIIMIALIAILFLFAYRKQSNYITKRIEANNQL